MNKLVFAFLLSLSCVASAATVTLNTTPAEDARIIAACGKELGLPGNCSLAQVKQLIINALINLVQRQEMNTAVQAAVAAVVPVAPN